MARAQLRKRLATGAVLALLGVALVWWLMRPAVVDVETAVASRGPLRQTVDAEGKTRVRDRFVIGAPVSGRLRRLTVREGDVVRPGDIVAWLAPLPLDETTRHQALAHVAAAEAVAADAVVRESQARVAADQARRTLQRRDALLAAGAIAPETREQIALELRAREAELASAGAQARATAADARAARAALLAIGVPATALIPVRSPTHGSVLRVPEPSERVVPAGASLLEVGDPTRLEIVVDVLSADAVRICAGQEVEIDEWGGDRPLRGLVRYVEPSAFTKVSALGVDEQRVNVVVDFRDQLPALGDGFRVESRIVVWESLGVLSVPASALFQRASGQWSVFVVDKGRARQRDVEVGRRSAERIEVLRGLAPGAEVILFPSDRIRDGVRVRAHQVATASSRLPA